MNRGSFFYEQKYLSIFRLQIFSSRIKFVKKIEMKNFIIKSLQHSKFEYLKDLTELELSVNNIVKQTVNKKPSFPCRVTLQDAEIGEEVFLLNYQFHNKNSPYSANGPIYIRPNKVSKICKKNEIPEMFLTRLISLRGYNSLSMLINAEVFEGTLLKEKIQKFLEKENIEYLHIHNAKTGCFLAETSNF